MLEDVRPIDPVEAVKTVISVLSNHLSDGVLENVRHALPKSIAALWPEMAN